MRKEISFLSFADWRLLVGYDKAAKAFIKCGHYLLAARTLTRNTEILMANLQQRATNNPKEGYYEAHSRRHHDRRRHHHRPGVPPGGCGRSQPHPGAGATAPGVRRGRDPRGPPRAGERHDDLSNNPNPGARVKRPGHLPNRRGPRGPRRRPDPRGRAVCSPAPAPGGRCRPGGHRPPRGSVVHDLLGDPLARGDLRFGGADPRIVRRRPGGGRRRGSGSGDRRLVRLHHRPGYPRRRRLLPGADRPLGQTPPRRGGGRLLQLVDN